MSSFEKKSKQIEKTLICCIDGNIGAGKSTLLKELERKGFSVFQEDLSDWGELLNRFYKDQKRWMCTLQVSIIHSMHKQYEQMKAGGSLRDEPEGATAEERGNRIRGNRIIFTERSPQSSMIFVKNGVLQGFLDSEENRIIQNLYNEWKWTPDISFYVDTPVKTCHDRILTRNRQCENEITTDYLQFLHEEYSTFYEKASPPCPPYDGVGPKGYRLDGTLDTSTLVSTIINTVSTFDRIENRE